MDERKIFFFLSILGIFILLILSQIFQPSIKGKIKSLKYGNGKITIFLEERNEEIVLFTSKILNLSPKQLIKIYGKEETYKNKTQIIAEKIF